MSELHLPNGINGSEIAIIGMSGRFPGAKDIETFWQNLREGVESVSLFSDEELLSSGVDSTLLHNPNYVKANPVVSDVEGFDAEFFSFSPKEAEITDPQHRLFLECAWEAIESAGYNPETYDGAIGVYAGAETNTYLINNIYPNFGFSELQMLLGNDKDYLCSRVSYKLNLRGPSVSVQTACSTSLVAIHMACQSLLNGECDISLAGGVTVRVPQKAGYLYQEGIAAPDGHCRAFDAKAQGSIFGSGVGIVVLKRLADAIADGDCIHAIIKGSAINNDGALKAGYTAPSPDGQSAVISEAQAIAGIEPETITYIEAHGSGTPLGDPIEIAALTQVFQNRSDRKGFCAIGSVKTNFGHLGPAAGVAGLIKTVLALKHRLIPPSLHFEQPNPKIDFANSPFYVNAKLSQWQTGKTPRRAGVSSLGIGGTNAHVILEEAPPIETDETSRPWQLLMLSAKTSSALETATANLAEHLKQHPNLNLADVAYTLQVGRRGFEHRRAVVCQDIEDAVSALQDPKRVLTSFQETSERPVAFMFTGLGTQYVNMAWELYQLEPTFQETVDRCCELLKPLLGLDLRDVLYPNQNQTNKSSQQPNPAKSASVSGFDLRKMLGRGEQQADEVTQKLNQTCLTQPAIFVIEYALAQLWQAWGIQPVAMIGYSIGEYVAATLAGVLSLEDALTLVAKRAQMIQALPSGAMLAVPLPEEKVRPFLNENLSLSAINGPSMSVIAGTTGAVDELASQLTQKGLACRRLQSSHAFHSHMMEAIAESFTELVKTVSLQPPKIPYVSNVTGTWITEAQATDPSYWTKHLCQPVRFADGIDQLWKQHKPILLEVGPGQTLSSLALQCERSIPVADKVVLPSLRDSYNQQSDLAFLLNTLGQLWLSGVQIDWSEFYGHERRHRLPLPTYPFERQRYWIDPPKTGQSVTMGQDSLERKPDPADWFYIPAWKQSMPPVPFEVGSSAQQKSCWLVFVDECGVGSQIAQRLENDNQDVISVRLGKKFGQFSEQEYIINPCSGDDYHALIRDLRARDKLPNTIVHLWSVKQNEQAQSGVELFEQTQHSGFYSLLFLTQALDKQIITAPLKIWVLSNGMHAVESADLFYPEKATVLGLCKVIPQEYSNITCQSIDLMLPQSGSWQEERLIDQLMAELTGESSDLVVAYRGNQRWLQTFEAVRLEHKAEPPTRLRQGGVYLITGGLGGISLTLAKYLAQSVQAKLVLTGRSGLPAKQEWDQWLATHDERDRVSTRIRKVKELEELGAEVLVVSADVANEAQMQAVITQTEARFNKIHGVIHAAATLGDKFMRTIPEIGYTEGDWQFQPKVYGLYTLEKVLQGRELDFCLLLSSAGAVLGGVGVAAYAAANIFEDAFAHKQNQLGYLNWCSANWFHAENANWLRGETLEQSSVEVLQKENVDAFQRILSNCPVPQIALWRSDLTAAINKWIKRKSWRGTKDIKEKEATPALSQHSSRRTPYVAPGNEIERKIANLYQELLGNEQVSIHDNFFDLGGHSLLATQLISRLRQEFQIELSLRFLFEAPSVAEFAFIIEEILIGEVEQLTEDEAQELVSVIPKQERASQLASQRRYKLPNNLEIVHQSKAETDYFYKDIFENQVYLKHGISLNDGDCIFDVGANIGLFTLFVNQKCKNTTIYAFEPAPPLFEILRLNTELHGVNVKLFNFGLSNETKTATFTFYPNSSGMSSFFADRQEEKEVLQAIMVNQLQSGMAGMEQVMEYSDDLLEERFKSQTFDCPLKTLSDLISEKNIKFINLLKIDVQKSELDVLKGIKDNHWKKIQQIVIEVHDTEGRLANITDLLKRQGYKVVAEQDNLYKASNIYNLYAVAL
jgi:FkbM family methyltransferase